MTTKHTDIVAHIQLLDVLLCGGKIELIAGEIHRHLRLPSETAAHEVYERLALEAKAMPRIQLTRAGRDLTLAIAMDPGVYFYFSRAS
ncbi:MAG: hypothetical protein MJE77_07245 [Proteobacteria bacterium]|nr:hypothetical protein [Pseudomonadota bacterium]